MLEIPKVLSREQLDSVAKMLAGATFVDGKLSAGSRASTVKKNQELDPKHASTDELNEIVIGNLFRHPVFQSAVLPSRVSAAFFARYTPGMAYGDHIDDPIMGAGDRYRAMSPSRFSSTIPIATTAASSRCELRSASSRSSWPPGMRSRTRHRAYIGCARFPAANDWWR